MTRDEKREKERLRHRTVKRKQAAAKAIAEGREPNLDFDRPKTPLLTEEEKRERRRVKSLTWRGANRERSREIGRDAMKRAAAARALEEGRIPGKPGRAKQFTEEELREKRRLKKAVWVAANLEKNRESSKLREREKRAGTFVSRARPKLTDEEKRLVNVAWAATRRTRLRENGGKFTKDDIIALLEAQEGNCALCLLPFGEDGYHVDHKLAVSLGGTSDPDNLQLLHPACNLKKAAKRPDELLLLVLPVAKKGD